MNALAAAAFAAELLEGGKNQHRGVTAAERCPYCAVGCGQLIYTKGGQLIDIEGDPRSPVNEGTLCPNGANAFQLAVNPHRVTQVLYRAAYSDKWETKSLDWAMERIAQLVIAPVVHAEIEVVATLTTTARGEGGFGHTGR
jgi:formate dehydrogenase major subunit